VLGAGHALEEIETLERAGRAFGIADSGRWSPLTAATAAQRHRTRH
jgi:hypothetical protein